MGAGQRLKKPIGVGLIIGPHKKGCNIANKHVPKSVLFYLYAIVDMHVPVRGSVSGSLLVCNTVVPESTVTNPQISDATLLAL